MNKFNNVFNENSLQNKQLNLHNIKYKERKRKEEIWNTINNKRFSNLNNINEKESFNSFYYNELCLFNLRNLNFEKEKNYIIEILIKIIISGKNLDENFQIFENIYQKLSLDDKNIIFKEISNFQIGNIKIIYCFINYIFECFSNKNYTGLMIFNKYIRNFCNNTVYYLLFSSQRHFLLLLINSLNIEDILFQFNIWSFIYNLFMFSKNSNNQLFYSFFFESKNIQILFENIKNNIIKEELMLISISLYTLIKIFEAFPEGKIGIFNKNLTSLVYSQKSILYQYKYNISLKSKKLEEYCDKLISIFNNLI